MRVNQNPLEKGNYAEPKQTGTATQLITVTTKQYKVGDGDPFHQTMRPGSDHSSILSRGYV